MIYFKKIKINNFESIKTKSLQYLKLYSKKELGVSLIDWNNYVNFCPEILEAFNKYELYPVRGAFVIHKKQEYLDIHIDYMNNKMHLCRINLPILNCEGSKTKFYKGGEFKKIYQPNGLPYFILSESSSPLIETAEVELTEPTIIRVQEPHTVILNKNNTFRVSLSLFMNKDPIFLLKE